ncbi:MAG: hypothetical protein M1839_007037 [Geoglossum umbratile]|nr:MAG: hypothetical protein M1839_007037 [Geoglossum umbratile]
MLGLGGTSLLNANVFLRADEKALSMDQWPPEIRNDPACLEKYYRRAESVLEPEPYPCDFPKLPKLGLLEKQAVAIGLEKKFYRVPQTTRFRDGPNPTGVEMRASTLTGTDLIGVNDGSKSSTLVNYLSDAWNWGAEIFCECEVRFIKKDAQGQGYTIFFAWRGSKREKFREHFHRDLMWVRAKRCVFLGAGSVGTSEILLRSKQHGLSMNSRVGMGMSGNGDVLAFGCGIDHEADSIANRTGPTITGVIDCRDQPNPMDNFVIQEGVMPAPLAPIIQLALRMQAGARYFWRLYDSLVTLGAQSEGGEQPVGKSHGLAAGKGRTQIYLVMCHDGNEGTLALRDDKPSLKFLGPRRRDHVKGIEALLAEATRALGGAFADSPFGSALHSQAITVHPLGGANMSQDGTGARGVTNHIGQVFAGNGSDIHEGLICLDGSIVPSSLGVNPFATITALAERAVEQVAAEMGMSIDYETQNGTLDLFGAPARRVPRLYDLSYNSALKSIIRAQELGGKAGIEFTEIMEGEIQFCGGGDGETEGPVDVDDDREKRVCSEARLFVSVKGWDVDSLLSRNDHEDTGAASATVTGTFTSPLLSSDPLLIHRGCIRLFAHDPRTPNTKNFVYDFSMLTTSGETIHLHGTKIVDPSISFSPLNAWKALSTLHVTLTRISTSGDAIIATGKLGIEAKSFVTELGTLRGVGGSGGIFEKVKASTKFLGIFAKETAEMMFVPFGGLEYPTTAGRRERMTRKALDREREYEEMTIDLVAEDGVKTMMKYWRKNSTPSPAQPKPNILFVPGLSMDHLMFMTPTIEHSAVEFFLSQGYDNVFCLTHRVGKTMIAQDGHLPLDARYDVKAALEEIRRMQHSNEKIYVIAHCIGSLATATGLLDGTIPAEWIAGITASAIFLHPIFGKINRIKASLPISPAKLYGSLVGGWYDCVSSSEDKWIQRALDQALRFYPVGGWGEVCKDVCCKRCELVFGRLFSHRNINSSTHTNLSDFFGGICIPALEQTMELGLRGSLLSDSPLDKRNIQRLEPIPIQLISGDENVVFDPESTRRSEEVLRKNVPRGRWERVVVKGYGHLDIWMGRDAWKDVFPRVVEHVERVTGGAGKGNGNR